MEHPSEQILYLFLRFQSKACPKVIMVLITVNIYIYVNRDGLSETEYDAHGRENTVSRWIMALSCSPLAICEPVVLSYLCRDPEGSYSFPFPAVSLCCCSLRMGVEPFAMLKGKHMGQQSNIKLSHKGWLLSWSTVRCCHCYPAPCKERFLALLCVFHRNWKEISRNTYKTEELTKRIPCFNR